jgi:predicted nucleic-acid-binding Zn-ribbon protein
MTSSPNCPKCSGQMEEGYVLDQSQGKNLQSTWVEGPPAPSFWTGLKMRGRERLPITTLRCERCGYLESYAEPA